MTRFERMKAVVDGRATDRIPYSIWYHLPHVDQDPLALAEAQVGLAEIYDVDFIKMMPFGNYSAQDFGLSVRFFCTETQPALERRFGVPDPSAWGELEPLPACFGSHGKQVQLAQYMSRLTKGKDLPYVQTVFSPFTTAKKLAGKRIFEDIKTHPALLHQALKAITETTVAFVKANIEAGVSGFFFATQCSSADLLTEQEHAEFCEIYDLQMWDAFKNQTFLNILHLHGDNTYYERLVNLYPCNIVNWHDRWSAPTLAEARTITDKCLMGGVNERWLETACPEEIENHIREALELAGRAKLVITPGCVAKLGTPKENYHWVRLAVHRISG